MRIRTVLQAVFVVLATSIVPLGRGWGEGLPDLPAAWVAGRADATTLCLRPDDTGVLSDEQATLARAFATLRSETTIGAPLLDEAARLGVAVCLDAYERGCDGSYACVERLILLDAHLDDGLRAAILVHELRHMDRAASGFALDLAYDVHAARTLTCASEADAQAIATWFAWRLARAGDGAAWRALMAHPHYGDIAAAFAAAIEVGAVESDAARAAFARWYASEWRLSTYRFGASLAYLELLDDTHRTISHEPLPDGYFVGFDLLPDGRAYGARPLPIE